MQCQNVIRQFKQNQRAIELDGRPKTKGDSQPAQTREIINAWTDHAEARLF